MMNPNQNQPNQSPQGPQQPPRPTPSTEDPTTPNPFEVHDYTHPIADKPKHAFHPKRFILWLSIIVAVCIVAVSIMLLVALLPPTGPKRLPDASNPKRTASSDKPLTAELTIQHVKEYFKGVAQAKSPLLRPVQAPGMAYFTVIPDTAKLVSVGGEVPTSKAAAQLTSIIHSLDSDMLTQDVASDGTKGANYQAYFTNQDTICELDQIAIQDSKESVWIETKCLDMSMYASYAAAQMPLVSLYSPLSATSVQYGFVGKPSIAAGSTAGYQRARLQVSTVIDSQMTSSGQYALYYQTPDGLWHYFTDQDNNVVIDCLQYKTKDLQSVYAGVPCRDLKQGKMSTVPVPHRGTY